MRGSVCRLTAGNASALAPLRELFCSGEGGISSFQTSHTNTHTPVVQLTVSLALNAEGGGCRLTAVCVWLPFKMRGRVCRLTSGDASALAPLRELFCSGEGHTHIHTHTQEPHTHTHTCRPTNDFPGAE